MAVVEQAGPLKQGVQDWFTTTHWSVIRAAQNPGSPDVLEAWTKLYRAYQRPIYAFIRRKPFNEDDAEDLTQGFFAHLLDKNRLQSVSPQKYKRFRMFLLGCLKNFLRNEWRRAHREKRGGKRPHISYEQDYGEGGYGEELSPTATPDEWFYRNYAMTVLDNVFERLRKEYESAGEAQLFQALRPHLTYESDSEKYSVLAARLGKSAKSMKMYVHRLRKRFGGLLRDEIANTVNNPKEIDEEIRYLITLL